MKIALVTEYYYPYLGGISEHVHNLYIQLKLRGYDVKIITPTMKFFKEKKRFVEGKAPESDVIRIGNSYPFYNNGGFVYMSSPFGLSRRLKSVFEEECFDIVHIHSPFIPVLPLLALKHSQCSIVGTVHTVFRRAPGYRVFRRKLEELLPKMKLKIAIAPECARIMTRYLRTEFKIISNGVDTQMFQPGIPPVAEFRKRTDVKYILFLGRFDPHNGLDILIKAFARVRKIVKNCEIIVVGDGPLAKRYKKMARPFGNVIHFVGTQHSLRPNYYQTADIFCHPATLHATSIVNLEAMASGLPIVASDLDSFKWALKDSAVYFPKGDDRALAEELLHLLANPSLCQEMRLRARQISLEYSWDKIGSVIVDEYRRLLGISTLNDGPKIKQRPYTEDLANDAASYDL